MAKALQLTKDDLLNIASDLLKLPTEQVWSEYDAEADVLYISFRKPQNAQDSVMENDVVYHYAEDDELVGMTLLHAKAQFSS